MSKSAHLKCTWTNCLIWSGISRALGLVLRILLWYFVVYLGDSSVYFDEFCYGIIWMLSLPAVFSVLCYIPTYKGYMNRAAVHPDDLYGVAHGQYGKPWILTLILLIVLDVIWLIVSALNVYFGFALDLAIEAESICFFTYLGLGAGNMMINIALFCLGSLVFQPNLVRKSR